ncbi:MAG: hypothetical protein IKS52_09210 [Clostridia bacterium]|nr:hypothetical protein [Clostridia bacterium]
MEDRKPTLSEEMQALLNEIGSLPTAGDGEEKRQAQAILDNLAAALGRLSQTVEAFEDQADH